MQILFHAHTLKTLLNERFNRFLNNNRIIMFYKILFDPFSCCVWLGCLYIISFLASSMKKRMFNKIGLDFITLAIAASICGFLSSSTLCRVSLKMRMNYMSFFDKLYKKKMIKSVNILNCKGLNQEIKLKNTKLLPKILLMDHKSNCT